MIKKYLSNINKNKILKNRLKMCKLTNNNKLCFKIINKTKNT